jgi:phosphate-selective porin OprO/OprP
VYHGGYAQVLYFLTGESFHYNKKSAVFERTTPYENFFLVRDGQGGHCCGLGAWQIGARYNYLDLNDQNLDGGILHNLTAGVNWYWNPNMKMQFNYSATSRDAAIPAMAGNADPGDSWVHGWGMRFAHDF